MDRSLLEAKISKLQNNHALLLDYRWNDSDLQSLVVREDWSIREVYQLLLTRIPPGSACAFLGGFNSEELHLFGRDFSNKVFSLRDYRAADRLLPVPPEVDYIISETGAFGGLDYQAAGFTPWFEVWNQGKPTFTALRRVVN